MKRFVNNHIASKADKIVDRFLDRSGSTAVIFLIMGTPLVIALILFAFGLNTVAWGFLIAAGVLIVFSISSIGIVGILAYFYDRDLDTDAYEQDLNHIRSLLRTMGPISIEGLQNCYKKEYGKLLDYAEFERRFKYAPDIEYDAQLNLITLTNMLDYDDMIPLPKEGDYIAGYYQMYKRLKIVKAQSEFSDVPLAMIDAIHDI